MNSLITTAKEIEIYALPASTPGFEYLERPFLACLVPPRDVLSDVHNTLQSQLSSGVSVYDSNKSILAFPPEQRQRIEDIIKEEEKKSTQITLFSNCTYRGLIYQNGGAKFNEKQGLVRYMPSNIEAIDINTTKLNFHISANYNKKVIMNILNSEIEEASTFRGRYSLASIAGVLGTGIGASILYTIANHSPTAAVIAGWFALLLAIGLPAVVDQTKNPKNLRTILTRVEDNNNITISQMSDEEAALFR